MYTHILLLNVIHIMSFQEIEHQCSFKKGCFLYLKKTILRKQKYINEFFLLTLIQC